MRRDIFQLCELIVLLQKHSRLFSDRVDRPMTVRRLTTILNKGVVSQISLTVGPLVEKIKTSSSPVISYTKYRRCA